MIETTASEVPRDALDQATTRPMDAEVGALLRAVERATADSRRRLRWAIAASVSVLALTVVTIRFTKNAIFLAPLIGFAALYTAQRLGQLRALRATWLLAEADRALAAGDIELAEVLVDRLAPVDPSPPGPGWASLRRAEIALARGDADRARLVLDAALDVTVAHALTPLERLAAHAARGLARALSGEGDAEADALEVETRLRRSTLGTAQLATDELLRWYLARAALARAVTAMRSGNRAALRRALTHETLGAVGHPERTLHRALARFSAAADARAYRGVHAADDARGTAYDPWVSAVLPELAPLTRAFTSDPDDEGRLTPPTSPPRPPWPKHSTLGRNVALFVTPLIGLNLFFLVTNNLASREVTTTILFTANALGLGLIAALWAIEMVAHHRRGTRTEAANARFRSLASDEPGALEWTERLDGEDTFVNEARALASARAARDRGDFTGMLHRLNAYMSRVIDDRDAPRERIRAERALAHAALGNARDARVDLASMAAESSLGRFAYFRVELVGALVRGDVEAATELARLAPASVLADHFTELLVSIVRAHGGYSGVSTDDLRSELEDPATLAWARRIVPPALLGALLPHRSPDTQGDAAVHEALAEPDSDGEAERETEAEHEALSGTIAPRPAPRRTAAR